MTRQFHMTLAIAASALASLAVGCGGGVSVSGLPLENDFTDCSGSFTMNDDVATVDCLDGELRILVSQPEVSPTHFVPLRFEATPDALVVSAKAHAPVPGAAWGIGCMTTETGEVGRGYAVLVNRSGNAGFLRMGDVIDGGGQEFETLPPSSRDDAIVRNPSGRHVLHLRCSSEENGAVRLRASVDGGASFTATDRHGLAPFTAAFPIVLTDRPGTDVRFDDVTARDATEQ